MTVNKISNSKLSAIKRKSAYALPDNPTGSGMSAEKIKNAFWTYALDENDSIIAEIHRIVDETNTDISTKESSSNKGVNIDLNSTNTTKFPTAKDVADYVTAYAEPGLTKNSAFNKNFETSTQNIKNNGSVSVGSLDTVARADHVHPFSDAETFAEAERIKSNNATYGAIVHQKEMETYAKALADTATATDITSSTLTTLAEYVDLFLENYPKTYRAYIGNADTSNFKTLVGNPFSGENYVTAYILPFTMSYQSQATKTFQVIAVGKYSNKLAIGYLRRYYNSSNVNQSAFLGWISQSGS